MTFGANEPGFMFSGTWSHNDNDGDVASLGLGWNIPLGNVLVTLGGKTLYLNPDDNDEGYGVAVGGGAQLPLGENFTLFGDAYYSPDSLSSGIAQYTEANAGIRWKLNPSFSVESGYRYLGMEGKDGHEDNILADGVYAGLNFSF
jgi:opacity protein-like surface antigen